MAVCMLAALTDVTRELELQGYDFGLRFSSAKSVNQDVVIIAIDDAALKEQGAWPWPRDVLASATDKLASARPAVIGFVLPFDSKQTVHGLEYIEAMKELLNGVPGNTELKKLIRKAEISLDTDRVLADSFSTAGRVVLPIPFLTEEDKSPQDLSLNDYLKKYTLTQLEGLTKKTGSWKDWFIRDPVLNAGQVFPPIEELAKQAGGAGTIYLGANAPHVRTEPLVLQYGDNYLPSFVMMIAARNKGLSTGRILIDLKHHRVNLGDSVVKVDEKLRIYPRFYRGKKDQAAFPTYSILDVLNDQIGRDELRNKTVLVGLTSLQNAIPQETPIGVAVPPVEVAAHKVSSLLNDELYAVPEWSSWVQLGALLVIGLYLMYVLPSFRVSTGFALSGLLLIGLLNAHFIAMIAKSIWIPLMTPMLALVIGHLVLGAKRYVEERLSVIHQELSHANQMLAQSFHSQGQLDQAFEKYRKCLFNTSLLDQLYSLGQDFERKRQYNKAASVFKYIAAHDGRFRDVTERMARNQEISDNLAMPGGGLAAANPANGTLVLSNSGMQKPMLGRYQIDSEIGRGAMGMVYLGHDPKIGRTVAIKTMMLKQEFEGEKLEEVKKRFFREAETAGRLNHPNIVTIYDVGDDQDLSYIAMDFLKGENLLKYAKQGSLLDAEEVFEIIAKVAEALDYAHSKHVVHRDVKPANIIYDKASGTLKVTDFGVACLTDTSKTKTGTILGSPSYMSPEQLAGQKVDGRSDLFSLGVTFYQLLSGELPFVGESLASLMYKIANEKHPDIRMFCPDLPSCATKIINKALNKDIDRRFQNGNQMAISIRRCLERF